MRLLVIFRTRVDHERAVNLFGENDPHELMRKGHFRKGQKLIRRPFDRTVQPAGRPDHERDLLSLIAEKAEFFGERFGRTPLSLDGKRDRISAQSA